MGVLIATLTTVFVVNEKKVILQNEAQHAEFTAGLVSQYVEKSFTIVEESLFTVKEAIGRGDADMRQLLARYDGRLSEIVDLAVVDPDGTVVAASFDPSKYKVNLRNKKYIKVFAHANPKYYISDVIRYSIDQVAGLWLYQRQSRRQVVIKKLSLRLSQWKSWFNP